MQTRPISMMSIVLLGALGCGTRMYQTRLSQPARLDANGVHVEVPAVHLSMDVRSSYFSDDSRVLVAFSVHHAGEQPMRFEPRALRLAIVDHTGKRHVATPLATGLGEPPQPLHDGEFTQALTVSPDSVLHAWAAFGGFPERVVDEIPERVLLELAGEAPGTVVASVALSDPGRPPVWHADPPSVSSGVGVSGQLWPGGSAVNFMFSAARYWLDPLWLASSVGVGLHAGDESFTDEDDPCCNIALRMQLGVPVLRGREGVISPYIGGEFAWHGDGNDSRALVGPSLGVHLGGRPIHSQRGPFPVAYERSVLSSLNLDIGFVWWLGKGTSKLGDPGVAVASTWTLGQ